LLRKTYNSRNHIWLIFILWPLLGFIYAWKNIGSKWSKHIILSFYALFGLLYVVNPLMDGARRADFLKEAYHNPYSDLNYYIDNLFESTLDFFDPLIIYTVSRFTDFHGFLFALYALIFGIFSLKFVYRLVDLTSFHKIKHNALLFLWLLIWTSSVFDIGGFRMSCAGWIFCLGAINYIINRKLSNIVFASTAIFMHFSYLPLAVILILYHFLGNRIYIYGIVAMFTFFIGELDISQVREYAALLSPAHEIKITEYTGEEYILQVESDKEQAAWFIKLAPLGILYFTAISLFLLFIKRKELSQNKILESLLAIALLLMSFSNIAALLPNGARFRTIFFIFAFSALFIYYQNFVRHNSFKIINYAGIIFGGLFILINFRVGSENFNAFLLGPSIIMPFGFFESLSLNEILF